MFYALRVAAAWAARLAICAALLSFAGFLFYWGTDAGQNVYLTILDFPPLDGSSVFVLLVTWGSLLMAALLTLVLRKLVPHGEKSRTEAHGPLDKFKRLLSWQLPPRAFFARWCGGLSLAEASGVLGWLSMNAVWLVSGLNKVLGDPFATWQEQLDGAAKLFGQMIAPNLMLLFIPIPHTNFVTWLTGVSRNRLIRFHRWLGHGALWLIAIHAILYYIYWTATGSFWANFKDWGTAANVNNLAGSLAFFVVLVLWATSLNFVRRHFYEFFFRCHLICFVSFFLLSCAHYAQCWMYFAPGLLLYAADLALRAGQMSNITTVAAATVDQGTRMATIWLKADKALQHRSLSEIWLLLPALSRWQWHPFSVASGGGQMLKLHIKQYGRFTEKLLRALHQGRPLAVRLSGPMGNEVSGGCQLTPTPAWHRHEALVVVAGGVGVTGMLSMLRSMVSQRAAAAMGDSVEDVQHPGLPRRVVCVWTARSMGEFLALDAPLLLSAGAGDGWLTFHLHLTGSTIIARERQGAASSRVHPDVAHPPIHPPHLSSSTTRRTAHSAQDGGLHAPAPGTHLGPMRIPGASAYCWSLLRPAQPLAFGPLHLAAVLALTFFGGFCGVLLGSSYLETALQWQGGMVTCVLLSAGALGLPFGLLVFPFHAIRYWQATGAVESGTTEEAVVPYAEQSNLHSQSCTLAKNSVTLPGTELSIQVARGRPDVEAILRNAARETGAGTVGVYAGGPSGLMQAVHLAVCQLNSESEGVYFELHNESVEL